MAKSSDSVSVLGMDYTIHKVRREQDPDLAENWEHQGFGQEETVVDWLGDTRAEDISGVDGSRSGLRRIVRWI